MTGRWLVLAALCGVVLGACGDDPPAGTSGFVDRSDQGLPDAGGPDQSIPDSSSCGTTLSSAVGASIALGPDASTDVTVLLADCEGTPIPDVLATFDTVGEAADSQLLARTAMTGSDGRATVGLRSGTQDASFDVQVTVETVDPLIIPVTVTRAGTGAIEVTIAVSDTFAYDAFRPRLFAATRCADIGPYDQGEPTRTAAEVTSTTTRPVFEDVAATDGYAVAVLADKDLGLLGYGCSDNVSVTGGETAEVTVTVSEIPVVFTGVYALDNEFDFSSALPDSIATTLQIFDEMTDDDDLYGNVALEEFGIDPAAFVLDFVYRQFCCWEATGSDPGWESCRAQSFQHPFGDLSDLYRHPFNSWDGAQPAGFGLCGVLAFGNETIMEMVQGFIDDNAPGVVLDLAQIAGDLSRAFTQMHVTSELTVADIWLTKTGNFTHELKTMIVELHDFDGVSHIFEFDLVDAGLTNLAYDGETSVQPGNILIIPDHAFRLDFGRLLQYIYLNGVLPLLDCDGFACESTGDLLATWLDCDAIGDLIWEYDPIGFFTPAQYADFCELGMDRAGAYLDDQITDAVSAETTLALEGSCEAGELDERRRATTLINGLWLGTIVEDSGDPNQFFGGFTGTRTGDL